MTETKKIDLYDEWDYPITLIIALQLKIVKMLWSSAIAGTSDNCISNDATAAFFREKLQKKKQNQRWKRKQKMGEKKKQKLEGKKQKKKNREEEGTKVRAAFRSHTNRYCKFF
jgi:hypothetical protein